MFNCEEGNGDSRRSQNDRNSDLGISYFDDLKIVCYVSGNLTKKELLLMQSFLIYLYLINTVDSYNFENLNDEQFAISLDIK